MSTSSISLPWDDYFMATAFLAAKQSQDKISKVGACIVNDDKVIVGIGYNRMPKNCNNLPWEKNNSDPLKNKYAYVVHAALNSILNSNSKDVKGCTLYTGLFPCNECAKCIIENEIKEVVYYSDKYAETWQTQASKTMFKMADVKCRSFTPKDPRVVIDFSDINTISMDEDNKDIYIHKF